MNKGKVLVVDTVPISTIQQNDADFISLTDIVRQSGSCTSLIENWLRNQNTLY